MRKFLHQGSCRFDILGRHDSVLKFHDIPSALEFLRRFKDGPVHMATLRAAVAQGSIDVHRMGSEEVLAQFAAMLVNGRVVMVRAVDLISGKLAEVDPEEKKPEEKEAAQARTPRPKSWVEINLRNSKGEPVGGERYRIKLPDGSMQEGKLDAFGHVEFYEINRGACEVSFPDLENGDWRLA